MLRGLVVLLILANAAMWLYTRGQLDWLGLPANDPREPQRVAQQVAPDKLVIRNAPTPLTTNAADTPATDTPTDTPTNTPDDAPPESVAEATPPSVALTTPPPEPAIPDAPPPPAAAAPTPPPEAPARPRPIERPAAVKPTAPSDTPAKPPAPEKPGAPATVAAPAQPAPVAAAQACWLTTGLSVPQAILLQSALEGQPGLRGRWSLSETVLPARWIVYLDPFPSPDALQRRRAALREAGIDQREINTPDLPAGLAIGTYSTQEGAQRALREAAAKGVRDARVVQIRPETRTLTLRLPAITEAERRTVQALDPLANQPLQRCP